jgi:D-alanyl-D-alanine carboxypeptidase (penicillin-binding protein 5/6)
MAMLARASSWNDPRIHCASADRKYLEGPFMTNRPQSMLRRLAGIAISAFLLTAPAHAFETTAEYAVLMDGESKAVLWAKDPDVAMHPASMSKLMTISMLFDALKDGSVKLTDTFPVSEHAWRSGGAGTESSTMFAELGSRLEVEALIRGIIVQSGNDACIVVAEALGGTEDAFARKMTKRGKELGLQSSNFVNSSGWPDPNHLMTAHDLALLARHIIYDFPEYYHYFKEKQFQWNGITQHNRNLLLYRDSSVDGLKTGHTEASKYGLTASAKRGDTRLILVVNGLASEKARTEESQRILDWGFRSFKSYKLFEANAVIDNAPVWQGDYSQVPLISTRNISLIMTPEQRKTMKVTVTYPAPIAAPIAAGQKVGTLRIEAENMPTQEIPLVSGADVERLGIFGRAMSALNHMILGS